MTPGQLLALAEESKWSELPAWNKIAGVRPTSKYSSYFANHQIHVKRFTHAEFDLARLPQGQGGAASMRNILNAAASPDSGRRR